ncbi:Glycosyltransferase 61 protein [Dioscorea alata]|uniref:Glycosyltransferase 61 protein n=1 Tax=Dioscorea alata TaxID=55571 RepID=A0ACB7VYF9_DIOAL|nr:Glycosyltransferase 61 protein [Dioscorea alata]
MDGHTWFMSSMNDTKEDGGPEHVYFPSEASDGQLLCLSGRSISNGTKNFYGFISPVSLTGDIDLLNGLTFISDTYYDYDNLWHGISAMIPFISWHQSKSCMLPNRWLLYRHGELRKTMSPWLKELLIAIFQPKSLVIEEFNGRKTTSCLEKAVVFRRNQGSMSQEKKAQVYDLIRCKTRAYCGIKKDAIDEEKVIVRLTLLLRVGKRSFKDDNAVISIFDKACLKVEGCRLRVARPNNLTFCDQVKLMSQTDVLATPHGAQLTNMIFMDKNSSVMEFFPKGWKELAGVGQHVYRWLAESSGINHAGQWNDPNGERCPESNPSRCFPFYKGQQIGYNESFFFAWTASVLNEMKEQKLAKNQTKITSSYACAC